MKGIIDGFDQDFSMVVREFSQVSPNLRLVEFFKFWNDHSLDCIFANRYDPRELLESISKINEVLVQTLASQTNGNNNRIVALYYLLCTYLKQPRRFRQKIRFNCDDIITTENMCYGRTLPPNFHRDARFAWRQLKRLQAVDFVEERLIYGPSMLSNKGTKKSVEPEQSDIMVNVDNSDINRFLESKIEPAMNELEQICRPYEQLRDFLRLNECSNSTVEMTTQRSFADLLAQARSLVNEFQTQLE